MTRQDRLPDQRRAAPWHLLELLVRALDTAPCSRVGGPSCTGDPQVHREAAVTMLLCLAFVRVAEEQGLLPLDNPRYHASYSLAALHDDLRQTAGATALPGVGAWDRVLATRRAIHSGLTGDGLTLPAWDNALFDPVRWPLLNGGPAGARCVCSHPSSRQIDDRTV